MEEYREELKKLAEKVMEVMDENLGLEKGYIKRAFSGNDQPFFGTKVMSKTRSKWKLYFKNQSLTFNLSLNANR